MRITWVMSTKRESSKKKKRKQGAVLSFRHHSFKGPTVEKCYEPPWQMLLCISLIQEDENCLIASAAFVS